MAVRRLVLVRHGETEGESSVRFHGSGDVALSNLGRRQMQGVARVLRDEPVDHWVASSLRRSWEGAAIASRPSVLPSAPATTPPGLRRKGPLP